MASVNQIKAATRSRGGKGAARAERRAGRVPAIIYGDGKPPLPISLDYADLRQRIYAGHFLVFRDTHRYKRLTSAASPAPLEADAEFPLNFKA